MNFSSSCQRNSYEFRYGGCAAASALLITLVGCAGSGQLAKIAAEKEQLVAAIESEKKLNSDLAARLQLASERAAEAERALALQHGDKPGGTSASLVNTPARRAKASSSLETWSRTQPLLKYDARRSAARVNLNLTFDDQQRLTLDSRRGLDQVADLLVSSGGDRYGISVAGIQTDAVGEAIANQRAAAVADWLRKRGIAGERVRTSLRSSSALLDEEGRQLSAPKSVVLEIVEISGVPDAVANDGWTNSGRR